MKIDNEISRLFLVAITPEYYTIELSQSDIAYIQRQEGMRERFITFVSLSSENKPVIKLEKKYGYLNKETFANEDGQQLNLKARALYSSFAARLTRDDRFTAEQIQDIVATLDSENLLDAHEKAMLEKILEVTVDKSSALDTVTDFICSRLCDEWTRYETECLPETLIKEFQYFISQEQKGWAKEVEETTNPEGLGLGKNLDEDGNQTTTTTSEN
jgi:hypothetical protein